MFKFFLLRFSNWQLNKFVRAGRITKMEQFEIQHAISAAFDIYQRAKAKPKVAMLPTTPRPPPAPPLPPTERSGPSTTYGERRY